MVGASEWEETAAERKLLAERAQRCIEMSKRLAQIDDRDSIYSREFHALTGLLLALPQFAEEDHMRLRSALRIAETVLTIQEELCAERIKQTESAQ